MTPPVRPAEGLAPALRRAIMRVKPEYFSWPAEAREQYHVSIPDEDSFRIRQTVLKGLFQIVVATEDEMEAALAGFDNARYLLFNGTLLPVMGIGEDSFHLCEHLDKQSLLDFDTLYDYDHADHLFQEQARKEEFPDYVPQPYRGSLYYAWARLRIDGAFCYANLCMAAGYVLSSIEEAGGKQIDSLIPYEYVEGKEHGKRHGGGWIYDRRIDAGGLEGQLEELKDRFRQYLSGRYDALQEENCSASTISSPGDLIVAEQGIRSASSANGLYARPEH